MDLIGRYDYAEIQLEGQPEALRALARAIRASRPKSATFALRAAKPVHWPHCASSLSIAAGVGNATISRTGDSIRIDGSPHAMELLAYAVEQLAERGASGDSDWSSEHMHIEYYPGHFYLSADSIPLIVQLQLIVEE